jgi:hypothetical protein
MELMLQPNFRRPAGGRVATGLGPDAKVGLLTTVSSIAEASKHLTMNTQAFADVGANIEQIAARKRGAKFVIDVSFTAPVEVASRTARELLAALAAYSPRQPATSISAFELGVDFVDLDDVYALTFECVDYVGLLANLVKRLNWLDLEPIWLVGKTAHADDPPRRTFVLEAFLVSPRHIDVHAADVNFDRAAFVMGGSASLRAGLPQ